MYTFTKAAHVNPAISDCKDVDECVSTETNQCNEMATCTNNDGSYICECMDGWDGDGKTCSQDICALCDLKATCTTVGDVSDCVCASGYEGDGYAGQRSTISN